MTSTKTRELDSMNGLPSLRRCTPQVCAVREGAWLDQCVPGQPYRDTTDDGGKVIVGILTDAKRIYGF